MKLACGIAPILFVVLVVGCGGSVVEGAGGSVGSGGSAGSSGSGGNSGSAGAGGTYDGPPSCAGQATGADARCGASADRNCCASEVVDGGQFSRFNDPTLPATVSSFRMDVFEVTVGRFRAFVDAYPGSIPTVGAGAPPAHPEAGWQDGWVSMLPATREELSAKLICPPQLPNQPNYPSWTDLSGNHERVPIGCLTWYEAFAFCAWDGGRLPTVAEWIYAADGGAEQRLYPWGNSPAPDPAHAVMMDTTDGQWAEVGSAPLGAGRWGQMDLNGSRCEWTFDRFTHDPGINPYPVPCTDCVQLDESFQGFAMMDLSYYQAPNQTATENVFGVGLPSQRVDALGVRCVRDTK